MSGISVTIDTFQTVTLVAPVTLSGTIADRDLNAVPDQVVRLQGSSGNISTSTDAQGNYSLSATPGSYTLRVRSELRPQTLILN